MRRSRLFAYCWLLFMPVTVTAQVDKPARMAWLWDEASMPSWSAPEVAIVVRHILLKGTSVLQRPRASSPPLAAATLVTPVVHVQLSNLLPPIDIEKSRPFIVDAMVQASNLSTSGWVQLDLEAHPSQRVFYKELVHAVRNALPSNIKLSVTTLAWWCSSSDWLDNLDADEVVPMFFRMGHDTERIRQMLQNAPNRLNNRCQRDAAGFSVQEPFPEAVQQRYAKTYWFDDKRWHEQNNGKK